MKKIFSIAMYGVCLFVVSLRADVCPGQARTSLQSADATITILDDDRVFLSTPGGRFPALLGRAANAPGPKFTLPEIFHERAVLSLLRVPCTEPNIEVWVTLTVGLRKRTASNDRPYEYTMYILKRRGDGAQILSQSNFPEASELIADDINGDGQAEIVVKYDNGSLIAPSQRLAIWTVSRTGEVSELPLPEISKQANDGGLGAKVDVELGDYKNHDWEIYSKQTTEKHDETEYVYRYFKWSPIRKGYDYRGMARTVERQLTPNSQTPSDEKNH